MLDLQYESFESGYLKAFVCVSIVGLLSVKCNGHASVDRVSITHLAHVNAICIRPSMLEIFFYPLSQRIWDFVEPDKFPYSQHLDVVTRCTTVQLLDNRTDVSKYTRVH